MTNSISCPVCSNLCSSQAISCPKCGHPINKTDIIKKSDKNPDVSTIGDILITVLWLFFVISFIYALGAISILSNMPLSAGGFSDAQISSDKVDIFFHIAPLVVMIIILAITYSAKGRR